MHLLALFLLVPMLVFGYETDEQRHARMETTIDFIGEILKSKYAPHAWKRECIDWDLELEIIAAKQAIQPGTTLKAFHRSLRDLFNSTKDFHSHIYFYATESAELPFRIKGVNGKYFFRYIDRNKLPMTIFSCQEGDEILSFGGIPIHEAVTAIRVKEIGFRNDESDYAFAEEALTRRLANLGHDVPQGRVSIVVKNSKGTIEYNLEWNYQKEKISPRQLSTEAWWEKKMLMPLYKSYQIDNEYDILGARKSFIPLLGKKLWESDAKNPFYAYLFETTSGKKVGYVRIPHYEMGIKETQEFGKLMNYFQEKAQALVIDQVNNPGGTILYMYSLVSMLLNAPLTLPMHAMAITQKEVINALDLIPVLEAVKFDQDAQKVLGDNLAGFPVNKQTAACFLDFFRFIVAEWDQGQNLTMPYPLYGIQQLHPHPTYRFTKPILVLVNGLSFSAADFLPAILQDNGRAHIMGTRTGGAGGYLQEAIFPNSYGIIGFHYTGSLVERSDGRKIENVGVTPDTWCELTPRDLQYNYYDYVEAIRKAIKKL